jgi:hypothetical protein
MRAKERKEKATAIAHSEAIGGIIFGREGARGDRRSIRHVNRTASDIHARRWMSPETLR